MSEKKLRVLHVLRSLDIGGAERLAVKLAALQKKSTAVEPSIACLVRLGQLQRAVEGAGLELFLIGTKGIRYISAMVRFGKLLAAIQPDIVHTHNFLSHVHTAPPARLAGVKIVHTKHGRAVTSFNRAPALRRWLYNLADRIVVVSRETGEAFVSKSGVKCSKIEVVHNGIDADEFSRIDRERARKTLGIDGDRVVFGSISRLDRVKDHRTMLEAFKQVVEARHDSLFLIVGDGPERQSIEGLINELSLGANVRLEGFTDRVALCLAAMDVFVQPSLEEGLSMTILEAMAAGKPVIATPVGGTPEAISDGESGMLVPVGDVDRLASAMLAYFTERARYEEIGRRARERVESEFSVKRMVSDYEKLYRQVIGLNG